jgi:glycine dehydrogenase
MEIATASLLDEGTAAAEAMTMLHRLSKKAGTGGGRLPGVGPLLPPDDRRPARARRAARHPREVGDPDTMPMDEAFGILLQYPDDRGEVRDLKPIIEKAHAAGLLVAVASDLLALTLLVPPGEMGADVVVGNSQRFGVPLGYGGPHAASSPRASRSCARRPGASSACRSTATAAGVPDGARHARAAHPPREGDVQHLHRAGAAGQHGGDVRGVPWPRRLKRIASRVHAMAQTLEAALAGLGLRQANQAYFDTLHVQRADVPAVRAAAEARASTSGTSTTRSGSRWTKPSRSRTSSRSWMSSRA